jgi:glycosyltransferase involved in cell wall biosynthesis
VHLDLVGPQGDYPLEEACDVNDQATLERMAPYFKKSSNYIESLRARSGTTLGGNVTFHGFVSRQALVDFYYNADVFVFPPIWNEAFGCTPVEAMAAGVPAVVTRCGGIVETVQDKRTGFLVEPNDAQALASVMLKLLEDDFLREKMGRAARQRALQLFTWDTIVGTMHARYQALLRGDVATLQSNAETRDPISVG